MAKKTTIRCPKCEMEYLPGAIYYPKDFVGCPTDIIKDADGNVLTYDGDDMVTTEEFVCDRCGAKFKVDASITFRTELITSVFDDDDDFDVPEKPFEDKE